MALKEGKEYTILNKEQLKVIFGNILEHHINGNDEWYEKFAGQKLPATYRYAIFPSVELGGNNLFHFSDLDALENILTIDKIKTSTSEIDYYHGGDAYYKMREIKITPKMKEKIKSLS